MSLFLSSADHCSPVFTWRQFSVSAPRMEQMGDLELLMEKSFGDEAAPPAKL